MMSNLIRKLYVLRTFVFISNAYGLIHHKGSKIELITLGILKLGRYPDHGLKLKHIFDRTSALINEYNPDEVALEAPFFGKNVQSMLKLGRAQGVAMAAALNLDVPIFEYSPRKIKQSITGKGNASKEQVAEWVRLMDEVHIQMIDTQADRSIEQSRFSS